MDPEPSRLHVDAQGRTLFLDGVIDSHTADDLDETLVRIGEAGAIALDLSAVTFIDSSGLRTILAAHARLADADQELVLVAPREPVRRLLAITNLDLHLRVVDGAGTGPAGSR